MVFTAEKKANVKANNLKIEALEQNSIAEVVVKMLETLKITKAYGVSGGAIAPLWAALERSSIEVEHFRQEAEAAKAAAEAYFASGEPVVLFTATGSGLANALMGLFATRWEGAKAIFVSPFISAAQRGPFAETEVFTSGKAFDFATTLEWASELPAIQTRLAKGLAGPGGFVAHLSVPTATQTHSTDISLPKVELSGSKVTAGKRAIAHCAELLKEGSFAIWVGFGARGAAKQIRKLAERTGAAVMCSPRAKGIFPEDHPQFIGVTGFGGHSSVELYMEEYLPQRVLVLGTRLGEFTSFWNPRMAPERGFIQVDLDLEALAPTELSVETLFVQSEPKAFVQQLLKRFPKHLASPGQARFHFAIAPEEKVQDAIAPVSVAEALVKILEELGVKLAFGVTGGAIATVWAALTHSSIIDVLNFRHEAGAAFAAAEAHFASKKPVVAFATTGPGFTNALTGLFAARWEGAKVIFLSASTPESLQGRWACQETSPDTINKGFFQPGKLFDYAVTVKSPEDLKKVAIALAKGLAKPGRFVAHINIPTDIQKVTKKKVVKIPAKHQSPSLKVAKKKIVKQCAKWFSKKPFAIWVGYEARDAAEQIRELAKETDAAVMCSPRAKGIFPENDPQFVGVTGIGGHTSVFEYMEKYRPERILVLGTRLSEFTSFWAPAMLPQKELIRVDINPEISGAVYPGARNFWVKSDAKAFVEELLEQLKKQKQQPGKGEDKSTPGVLPRPEQKAIAPPTGALVRPGVLMQEIQKAIVEGSDALVMAEPGNSFAWATNMLRFKNAKRYRTSTGFASMGHTVTGVVGAARARGGKAVSIAGDGAMLMNCEISTAVEYQIPAVWIVLNDSCYNMVDQVLPHLQCKDWVQLPKTDFVEIARGMGADGIRVETESDLKEALQKALEAKGPFVVDVQIDPNSKAPTETRMNSLKNQGSKKVKG